MKNRRKTNLKEKGITLIALVVTIIVLLILAGITINLALSNNGIIQRAKDASETYAQAEQNDAKTLKQLAEDIYERTGKTGLPEDEIEKINKRIKDPDEELQEVPYEAKEITDDETSQAEKGRSVTVEGAYSGTGTDQVFYQSDVGAIGSNKLKWYVLSADEKGVNLVSEPTKKSVQFQDSSGYDNCLYYLNELSTKLFANEEYGVTAERIHALNLTDIKTAAEQANAGTEWDWDTDVINKLTHTSIPFYPSRYYTNTSYTYHPAIYPVKDGTTEVEANNPMYDEEPGSKITTDGGIKREETGNPASKLTINDTAVWDSSVDSWKGKLGIFGSSRVAGELFKSGSSYWLASRCVSLYSNGGNFSLREVGSGCLSYHAMCSSYGFTGSGAFSLTLPLRVVVSVPGSRVNIADGGTVTLKPKNS